MIAKPLIKNLFENCFFFSLLFFCFFVSSHFMALTYSLHNFFSAVGHVAWRERVKSYAAQVHIWTTRGRIEAVGNNNFPHVSLIWHDKRQMTIKLMSSNKSELIFQERF